MGEVTEAVKLAPYIDSFRGDTLIVKPEVISAGWEQWYLLMADVHFDHPQCRRDMLLRHLRLAADRDARIVVGGDLFCLMQGRNDPRHDKRSLRLDTLARKEKGKDRRQLYYDAVEDEALEFWEPYADRTLAIYRGNHEESAARNSEHDLLSSFGRRLGVAVGGYAGWVFFRFTREGGGRTTKKMFVHHGYGGGGAVTMGVNRVTQMAAYSPDADIVMAGHIHSQWWVPYPRQRVSASGVTYQDMQHHIQLPTYKQEYTLEGGYHMEKGRPPKPLGAWWMRFFYASSVPGNVAIDFTMAY